MKKKRFSVEQIVGMLKQVEMGGSRRALIGTARRAYPFSSLTSVTLGAHTSTRTAESLSEL